jgi:PAS domain S-box-containing protein
MASPATTVPRLAPRPRGTAAARVRPCLVAGAVAVAVLPLAGEVRWAEAGIAGLLFVALVALFALVPSVSDDRRPDVAAIVGLVVVAVLRDATGGPRGGYGVLAVLPVLWVALHGRPAQLWRTVTALALVYALPVIVIGAPRYASSAWRAAVLVVVLYAVIGVTVQHLLRRERGVIADRTRLLEAIADGVIVTDIRGRVLEVNPALCTLTGYDAEEIVGAAPPLPSWPHEDRAMLARKHGEAVAAGGGEFEARLIRRDGAEIYVLVRLSVRAGGPGVQPTVIATVKDVTERVAMRRQLSAERDHSRAVLDSLSEGYAMTRDNVLVDVNPALCHMTGFRRDELIGTAAPFPFWPPELVASLTRLRTQVLSEAGGVYEATLMRADGTRFAAEITTTPVHEHGRHAGYLACVRDVTERKEAEQAVLDRTKQFAALARVTRAVAHAGPEEARHTICDMAMRSVDADYAAIWEADGQGNLHNTMMIGAPPADVVIPRDFSTSGARIAYRTAEPVFIAEAADSPAVHQGLRDHIRCSSVHFQPIASELGVSGVLALAWREPRTQLGTTHAHLIEVLAHEASIATARRGVPALAGA